MRQHSLALREGRASDLWFAQSIDRLPFPWLGDGRQTFSAHAMASGKLVSDRGGLMMEISKRSQKIDVSRSESHDCDTHSDQWLGVSH